MNLQPLNPNQLSLQQPQQQNQLAINMNQQNQPQLTQQQLQQFFQQQQQFPMLQSMQQYPGYPIPIQFPLQYGALPFGMPVNMPMHQLPLHIELQHPPTSAGPTKGVQKLRKRKTYVKACQGCQQYHSACDTNRPCKHCLDLNLSCVDVERKKKQN